MSRLAVSFSGGRTSAMMLRLLMDARAPEAELVVLFANTGQEHPATLEFVRRVDEEWRAGIVWLEAEVHAEIGAGTTHRVVSYESATRNGARFADVARKYGLPNQAYPHCTRELKQRPIRSYLRSIGWNLGHYGMAIGIRADEIDRMSPRAAQDGIVYPLVRAGITKSDVSAFWSRQPFNLDLPHEAHGNCVWCWKKSDRKLLTIMRETPGAFEVPRALEAAFANHGAGHLGEPRRMFRGQRTVADIESLAASSAPSWLPHDDHPQLPLGALDIAGACGDSCEPFADEDAE